MNTTHCFWVVQGNSKMIKYKDAWKECLDVGGKSLAHFLTFDLYSWFTETLEDRKEQQIVPWINDKCRVSII